MRILVVEDERKVANVVRQACRRRVTLSTSPPREPRRSTCCGGRDTVARLAQDSAD